ncbi:nucleotide disphospho-sugar-binding domain-containing protein [Streptomyces cyaneofuscatus]|uniref:nucleotide disphospho-sugar-binding domain-containing protein n=1 Tax=Streptomyces cyaneofuscatus TaxID=66883 RepID=UPI003442A3A2
MRVLFTIFPATAHLYPVVPLAYALQSAGHEVCVATTPDLAADITAVGLKAVPVGEPVDLGAVLQRVAAEDNLERLAGRLGIDEAGLADPEVRKSVRYHMISMITLGHPSPSTGRVALADLVDFGRSWSPDLVLWDPMCFGAAVAARASGAAHARVLWGIDLFARFQDAYVDVLNDPGDLGEDLFIDALAPTMRQEGLAYDRELLYGQWSVDLMPQRMSREETGLRYLPVRRVAYNGPGVYPEWLLTPPKKPRVCLTMGMSMRKYFEEDEALVTELLATAAGLDAEVVATVDAGQFAADYVLPDNVRTIDYVPLDLVLPTCAAIVHHGGTGTYAAAVAHEVPQLILPTPMGDHLALSRYVAERGGGLYTERADFSPEVVREQLVRLLSEPSFRQGATELRRDLLASPSPVDSLPALEKLTAQYAR